MPVIVRRRRGKFRVVEAGSGHIAKSSKGNAADGGGHIVKAKADRQARAINAAWTRKQRRQKR